MIRPRGWAFRHGAASPATRSFRPIEEDHPARASSCASADRRDRELVGGCRVVLDVGAIARAPMLSIAASLPGGVTDERVPDDAAPRARNVDPRSVCHDQRGRSHLRQHWQPLIARHVCAPWRRARCSRSSPISSEAADGVRAWVPVERSYALVTVEDGSGVALRASYFVRKKT